MRSIRSFFLTLSGLTFVAIVAMFTASVGIAIAGAAAVLLFGQWLSAILTQNEPKPVRVRTRDGRQVRVWDDGRGTIIDR